MGNSGKDVAATTLEMRILQRGVEILGSERALARHLHLSMPDLLAWLKGAEKPTRAMFLAAVDLLIEHNDKSGLGALHSLSPDRADSSDSRA